VLSPHFNNAVLFVGSQLRGCLGAARVQCVFPLVRRLDLLGGAGQLPPAACDAAPSVDAVVPHLLTLCVVSFLI